MSDATRQYRRELLLHVMAAAGPSTAADLSDAMKAAARAEEHPTSLFFPVDGSTVAGMLKTLAREERAEQVGELLNQKRGRNEPLWALSGDAIAKSHPMPWAPDPDGENDAEPRALDSQPGPLDFAGLIPAIEAATRLLQEMRAQFEAAAPALAEFGKWMEQARAEREAHRKRSTGR